MDVRCELKALVTGITGQDGAYLAELLLKKGYEVVGAFRSTSTLNLWRLNQLKLVENQRLKLETFEITDLAACIDILTRHRFDEVFNLAAQSFVGTSFGQPIGTAMSSGIGPMNLLEAIRIVSPETKFYQASTSELFGKVQEVPQTETTPFYPRSPYAVAKQFAHWCTINYRESYNLAACCGILFNHESPLRGREFVTRKITNKVASIKMNDKEPLQLGNLDAKRDWGFAKEYVEGMWLMLQQDEPQEFVLSTGTTTSVRDFCKMAFAAADMQLNFEGDGENEVARLASSGKIVIEVNSQYYRPAEVDLLIGDPSKATKLLNWTASTSVEQLASMMVEADINYLKD